MSEWVKKRKRKEEERKGILGRKPLKKMVAKADGKTAPAISLVAGGIAGGIEAACTYPFEFAKTRVQLYGHEGVRNPFYVVAKVAKEEGVRALYKGCSTMIVAG